MKNKYFKTIALLSATAIVGVIFILYHAYDSAVHMSKEHTGVHHLGMAEQAGRGIEREMQTLVEQLKLLSGQRAIKEMDISAAGGVIGQTYEYVRQHSVNDIALMDAEGIVRLALNAPELNDKDFSFRKYYQEAMTLKTSSPVYEYVEFKGVTPGQKGIIIAIPAFSMENRFSGVVLFTIRVNELLGNLLYGETTDTVWVVDGEGNILYHPDYSIGSNIRDLKGEGESINAFLREIMDKEEHRGEYYSPEGFAVVAAARSVWVAGEKWAVVVASPAEEASGVVVASSVEYGIGILLLIFGAAGVIFILRSYNNSLHAVNEELESRVKERTADLVGANEELEKEIVEHLRAEKELREITEKLGQAQKVAKLGFWDLNLVTGELYWSDEAFRIYGFEVQAFAPSYEKFISLVHPEDRRYVQNNVDAALKNDVRYDIDFRFVLPTGEVRYMNAAAEVFRDEKGQAVRFVGTQLDITERKRAEEELAYSEQFLKSIIDNEPECVKIVDADGTLMDMNASGLQMIDADNLEQVKGQNVYGMVAPEFREIFKEHVERVCRGEKSMMEFRAVGLKGRSIWLETHAVPFDDTKSDRTLLLAVTRDITERKRQEESLRLLLKAVEALPVGVTISDTGGKIIYTNSAEAEMHGYTVEELMGMNAKDLAPASLWSDRPFNELSQRTLRKQESVNIREDGSEFAVQLTSEGIGDEEGRPIGVVTVCEDITKRKIAEEALRQSEERYHGLFDSAQDAIIIADADSGVIVNANRSAEVLLGKHVEEIVGMHQSELHPQEESEFYKRAFNEAIRRRRTVSSEISGEMYVVAKDGKKIPVEISGNVIEIEGRKLVQGIFRDITKRKEAERAAREGKQFLENVLNSIQDGICILDMDCNVVMTNPTMEKWYAHRAPVTGKKCYKVFKDSPDMCDKCPCEDAMVGGDNCSDMLTYKGQDGRDCTLELHAFPLLSPDTGEQIGVIEYLRDITDRVTLQAEAFRAAQLASVGELAAGVAHEINNPVNGIINYAQLLLNRLPEQSEDSKISRLIIKEGDRISGIVSSLLSYTRDYGPLEEIVHLDDILSEVLSLTGSLLAKDGIKVSLNIPEDMPTLRVRRQHIEQVFLNVINNARHALNEKYPRGHEEKVLEIRGENMKGEDIPHVRISFTDRGTGISLEIIDKVVEPFFTTKQKGTGTGLGLSISRGIIENHGGRLSVESAQGEYTRINIDLPIGEGK